MSKLAQYNKTIVVVLGLILLVGSDVANNLNSLLPPGWITTLNVALGVLTAFLTFWVGNEPLLEGLGRDVAQPSLGSGVDAVAKVSELTTDIRTTLGRLQSTPYPMYTSTPAPREVAPVSVVVNTPAAPVDVPEPAPAAPAEAPAPDPAPEPTAPTGTYPDGPYVPPNPAYTGPIPPVSEPVGATAVSAAP